MKQFVLHTFLLMMLTHFSALAQSGSFPNHLIRATQNGDAATLAAAFNDNVELVLPGKSGIYSRSQAEMVVRDFFSSADPQEFKIMHEGTRDNASYVIGTLVCKSENFRVYFLTKSSEKKIIIHQLRIERQDD